ncbi:MAG TPA: hypothetical protein VJ180_04310 [Pyrinomonadaceae bacterium]|nr:hypothetical protein [Pyrinomonadaceae bacterium]
MQTDEKASPVEGIVRWVPVAECLPLEEGGYLMFGTQKDSATTLWVGSMPGYFKDGQWYYYNDDEQGRDDLKIGSTVTLWAEFPVPPIAKPTGGGPTPRQDGETK